MRRALVLYVLVPYLVVTLGFAVFQRKLLYRPTVVAEKMGPKASLLPAGRVQALEVTTHDGLTLNGWLVRAEEFGPGRKAVPKEATPAEVLKAGRPVVLYFSGNSGNRADHASDCRDFTTMEADVVLFDYRGFGDNPGSPSEGALAADAHAIWDLLTKEYGVPPERIVLFGESLGGGVATRLASELCKDGTPPAGLVLASTFSSMTDAVAWHYPYFPVRLFLLDRYPSKDRITEVTCPIVCMHGTSDDMVPIELGRKLFEAAPERSSSGVQKRFVEASGSGHNGLSSATVHQGVRELFRTIATAP
ncbi:MAG: alpha/beta hydrolase [Pirellulales bacterium]|nr:alpha/beta hydrolase [Pirellulales bacterium]